MPHVAPGAERDLVEQRLAEPGDQRPEPRVGLHGVAKGVGPQPARIASYLHDVADRRRRHLAEDRQPDEPLSPNHRDLNGQPLVGHRDDGDDRVLREIHVGDCVPRLVQHLAGDEPHVLELRGETAVGAFRQRPEQAVPLRASLGLARKAFRHVTCVTTQTLLCKTLCTVLTIATPADRAP